jgi:hypothetical protein
MFFNIEKDNQLLTEPYEITIEILKQLKISDLCKIRFLNKAFNTTVIQEKQKLIANRIESSPIYREISDYGLFSEGYQAKAITKIKTDNESESITYMLRSVGKYFDSADGVSTYTMKIYHIILAKDGRLSIEKIEDEANGLSDHAFSVDALFRMLGEERVSPAFTL